MSKSNDLYRQQKRHLLSSLENCDYLRFENKVALGKYIETIERMVKEGLITTHFGENEEDQCGWFDIRKCNG